MAEKCKECGCMCVGCSRDDQSRSDVHLHVEIENLRQRLLERDNHIVTMETQFLNEAERFPNGELASIKEDILTWQEKYSRLYEAHKRVQKVNQNLEDKLLRIVDKCETEKGAFAKDVATLSHRLADANYTIRRLTQDNEMYRNDVNLAIQLLQCKPSNFVGQKYDSLPAEVQTKVKMYVAQKRRSSEVTLPDINKSITVPISTFPPTAMVYNVTKASVEKDSDNENDESKAPVDIVSAAIMAKVLEDRERERIFAKHCDTCTCHRSILTTDTAVQTTTADLSKFNCNVCENRDAKDNVQSASVVPETVGMKDNPRPVARHYERNDNSSKRLTLRALRENSVDDGKSKFRGSIDSSVKHFAFQRTNEKGDTRNIPNSESPRVDTFKSSIDSKGCSNTKNSTHQCNSIGGSDNSVGVKSYCRTNILQNRATKQGTDSSNAVDKLTVKTDTARQVKRDTESKTSDRCKLERNSCRRYFVDDAPRGSSARREQSRVDVINERLRKNEWTKRKDQLGSNDVTSEWLKRASGEVQIDAINDRIWKNERSRVREEEEEEEEGRSARLTLIEVTGADHSTNRSDCWAQTENAASPSFSSDSIVISTSDPPSSCSDSVRPIKEKKQQQQQQQQSIYNDNLRAVSQDRTAGPRNCLMRVTPGSQNVLLDNTGHYQTVLYTSGSSNRPSTALVHATKSLRSGRSTSTSSEENCPILPQDDVQLQRVAEWVRASGPADKVRDASLICISESESESKASTRTGLQERCNDDTRLVDLPTDGRSTMDAQTSRLTDVRDDVCTKSAIAHSVTRGINDLRTRGNVDDLMTFDLSNDPDRNLTKTGSVSELNYDVKITREMEETYLKLAASLDPVTLRLSSSTSADLTIEKYRRDHKRLNVQKTRDKSGSAIGNNL